MPGFLEQCRTWDKLMLGMSLSEDEYKEIAYPEFELHVHVATKTVQAGAFLGQCLVAPIYMLIKRKNPNAWSVAKKFGPRGMLIGLVAGPIMTMGRAKSANVDWDGFFDRSYRIRKNEGQVNVDRFSYLFGILGLIATRSGFGLATGVNAGWMSAAVYNNYIKKKSPDSSTGGGISKIG